MSTAAKNRNARRTERLILESFVSLLNQGRGDKLTVAEICREADINRSTFYAHYETLDDFKSHVLDGICDIITQLLDGILSESFASDPSTILVPLGTYYQENLTLYRAVSSSYTSVSGMDIRNRILAQHEQIETADLVRFDMVLSSLLSVVHTWSVGDYGDVPIESLMDRLAPMYKAMLSA